MGERLAPATESLVGYASRPFVIHPAELHHGDARLARVLYSAYVGEPPTSVCALSKSPTYIKCKNASVAFPEWPYTQPQLISARNIVHTTVCSLSLCVESLQVFDHRFP
jgi:hypothetical protein